MVQYQVELIPVMKKRFNSKKPKGKNPNSFINTYWKDTYPNLSVVLNKNSRNQGKLHNTNYPPKVTGNTILNYKTLTLS